MAGYLLTGDRSNFVRIDGASLLIYECKHFSSPLYTHKGKCFDTISIYNQETICYVDTISHKFYSFATEKSHLKVTSYYFCIRRKWKSFYLLTPTPIKEDPQIILNLQKFEVHFNQTFFLHIQQAFIHPNIK